MSESAIYLDDIEVMSLGLLPQSGHENPIAPGTRDRLQTIPGLPGALDYGADLEPIRFSLPFEVAYDSRYEVQRTVRAVKSILIDHDGKPKTFKLKFGYEPDKFYRVRYAGRISIDRLITIGKFSLPLICFDGYAQSVAKNDEVTWGSEVIPFWSDFTFGHTGDGSKTFTQPGPTIITVTGDNLKPVLHISGSGTDVTIEWGGNSFSLDTFTEATWTINLESYEVEKDGTNALHLIGGDWLTMKLENGENEIRINGSGLDLTFRVEFRDRYF